MELVTMGWGYMKVLNIGLQSKWAPLTGTMARRMSLVLVLLDNEWEVCKGNCRLPLTIAKGTKRGKSSYSNGSMQNT